MKSREKYTALQKVILFDPSTILEICRPIHRLETSAYHISFLQNSETSIYWYSVLYVFKKRITRKKYKTNIKRGKSKNEIA